MNIEYNGASYTLDVPEAIKAGFLKKRLRPVKYRDIPNGCLFRYTSPITSKYRYYLMIDNTIEQPGQCRELDTLSLVFFSMETANNLSFLSCKQEWVSEVE